MSEPTHQFNGRCHCGGIAMQLAFTRPAEATQVRSCQCGFCMRHGTLTVSDPAGRAVIEIAAGALTPYRFATATATSLICRTCGTYAGAVVSSGNQIWSIANARGLAIEAFKGRTGIAVVYEEETADQRIDRRREKWTPTEIRFKIP